MSKVITGLFNEPENAAYAVNNLVAAGIAQDDISLVASESLDQSAFAVETHSKVAEGAAIGAGAGGAIGAVVAGFTAVGAIATGGAGLLIAGPLVAALAGAGAGAAVGGSVGGLVGLAVPEHELKHYENAIDEGAVLVGVHYEDSSQKDKAKKIFEKFDAEKISHA